MLIGKTFFLYEIYSSAPCFLFSFDYSIVSIILMKAYHRYVSTFHLALLVHLVLYKAFIDVFTCLRRTLIVLFDNPWIDQILSYSV